MSEAALSPKNVRCYEFKVNGMHCTACELLIEDRLKESKGVKSVEAKLSKGTVKVEVDSDADAEKLALEFSKLVKDDGYEILAATTKQSLSNWEEFVYAIPIAIIFLLIFAILQTSGILNTGATTNLFQTFVLGIIASLSSCMALVGGLVLALSNKYAEAGIVKSRAAQISFHIGRIGGFFFLGGILGVVGAVLKPTLTFALILTVIVSVLMLALGINQLGIFKGGIGLIKLPKGISRKLLSLQDLNYSFIPLILGLVTFFLPCGFTLAVQGIALEQGNFLESALTMFTFALGTFPVLGLLSFASVNFAGKLKSGVFMKTTGL